MVKATLFLTTIFRGTPSLCDNQNPTPTPWTLSKQQETQDLSPLMAKGPKATSGPRTREIKCGKVLLSRHILKFLLIGTAFALLRRNLPYKVGSLQFWVRWTCTYQAVYSISSDAAGEISSQSVNGFRGTVARFVPVATSWECIISSSQSRVSKDQLYTS